MAAARQRRRAPPAGARRARGDGHRRHVVSPLFFPGGDIGCLSVHGTVNDVAMWARGRCPVRQLHPRRGLRAGGPEAHRRIDGAAAREAACRSSPATPRWSSAARATAFISTTGVGVVPAGIRIDGALARRAVLLSGTIGDHGVAIMSQREALESSTRSLRQRRAARWSRACWRPCRARAARPDARRAGHHAQRDRPPVRRRHAAREDAIPVLPQVDAACELLGLDPLYVANEGKLVAVCAAEDAPALLAAMRAHPLGAHAVQIGEVTEDAHGFVQVETKFGGRRIADWLSGEQLPRIC
jgi:hydrogenase expression/formation protein HypE